MNEFSPTHCRSFWEGSRGQGTGRRTGGGGFALSDLSQFSSPPLTVAFSGFYRLVAVPRRHFPGSWQLSKACRAPGKGVLLLASSSSPGADSKGLVHSALLE